jgi:hypothetical protein
MGESKRTPKFFVGAVALQPMAALDAFVRAAEAGNEFVYCEAPSPMHGDTWTRAGELAQQGLIRTHQRRRPGGGWQYYAVRTGRSLPREVNAQDKILADRATAAIFAQLKREANMGQPCSSDTDLARHAGLTTRAQAQWRVRGLVIAGLIESQLVYEAGVPSRVITIARTRHAGGAADKTTALPKKWASLRAAAQRDAGGAAAGGRG